MNAKTDFLSFGEANSSSVSDAAPFSLKSYWNEVRNAIGGNNLDQSLFDCLQTLEKLKSLPESHDFHIQPEVADIASKLIAYLDKSYGIESPKLLPENDECVALTWENSVVKRHLAVYKDAIDIMFYSKNLKISCKDYLCDDGNFDFDYVGKTLSKSGKAKSITAV